MKEINRMCNIAKIVFNDNLLTFALENDVNSKYYIANIIVKKSNTEQLKKFIIDCNELISKPVTSKMYIKSEIEKVSFNKILIDNN